MTQRSTPNLVARLLSLCLIGIACAPAARADLAADIQAVLKDRSLARAEVGVQVVRIGATPQADQVLFGHNSDLPLIPASNLKLVTTSAALDRLGPDFKFRTLLLRHNNDLVLIGDGDPSLGDAELLKKSGWDATTLFRNWAEQLKKAGVSGFDRVVIDDSVFDDQFAHRNWPADQLHKRYVAQVGGLNLNVNCVDFTLRVTTAGETVRYLAHPPTRYVNVANTCVTGNENAIWLSRLPGANNVVLKGQTPYNTDTPVSVTIHDPGMFTATVLQETLVATGLKVGAANPVRDRTLRAALLKTPLDQDPSWSVLAIHETPLATALARANKDSVNVYAEALCKRVGAAAAGGAESGSWKNGAAALGEHLEKAGVPASEFKLDDGCGLSKENAISANGLCRLLTYNWHNEATKDAFFASLSVVGKDGTLENRFANTDLRGRVFGKSGFVNNVRTLSGYLKAKDGQWYAYSILINQLADTVTGKNLQEAIVRAVDARSRELATVGQ
jgi:D-alanyl-D-alanine carboxypeptidase/D-alanyl-D-alanine-endopeptidase (penicillin-binding protein 4)